MVSICGLEYFGHGYCILVAGHSLLTPHQVADGFRWDRQREESTDKNGQVYVDYWGEPVGYELVKVETQTDPLLDTGFGIPHECGLGNLQAKEIEADWYQRLPFALEVKSVTFSSLTARAKCSRRHSPCLPL